MGAANAVLCGFQLQADQKAVKESGGTFEQWLEKNEKHLGFSRRTAFRYLDVARDQKSKLLKSRNKAVLALLDRAPSSLSKHEAETLIAAVTKSVNGQSLRDLLEDLRIARAQHHAPRRIGGAGEAEAAPATRITPIEEEVEEQLELFGQRSLALNKTYTLGNKKVHYIAHWPKPKIKTAIQVLENDLRTLREIEGAMK